MKDRDLEQYKSLLDSIGESPPESGGEMLVYQADDGQVRLEVRLQNESVWLTQQMMAELFRTSKQNISHHIHGIYEEGELQPEATHKKFLSVRREGNREIPLRTQASLRSFK